MKPITPKTDSLVKTMKGWKEIARARNLAFLCRQLETELNEWRECAEKLADGRQLLLPVPDCDCKDCNAIKQFKHLKTKYTKCDHRSPV